MYWDWTIESETIAIESIEVMPAGDYPNYGSPYPEQSFRCPKCGVISFNPNDVRMQYCNNCNEYWQDKAGYYYGGPTGPIQGSTGPTGPTGPSGWYGGPTGARLRELLGPSGGAWPWPQPNESPNESPEEQRERFAEQVRLEMIRLQAQLKERQEQLEKLNGKPMPMVRAEGKEKEEDLPGRAFKFD